MPFYKIMVPTVDTVRYDFLVYSLLQAKRPVLLTGPVGTGKTSLAQKVLQRLDPKIYSLLVINMSAQVLQKIKTEKNFWTLKTGMGHFTQTQTSPYQGIPNSG